MKLEKDDRIISNADYEKLVGLAELHEKAIREVVTETISNQFNEIKAEVSLSKRKLKNLDHFLGMAIERANERHGTIQKLSYEIARLKQPWWKRVF